MKPNSRLKVALGGRGGLECRIPVAACRELERGACCKKEKGKSSQLRSHRQGRQPSLGVGLYAPIATLAKRHSTRYFSPSRGLLNRPSQIDVWIAVRSVWRRDTTTSQAVSTYSGSLNLLGKSAKTFLISISWSTQSIGRANHAVCMLQLPKFSRIHCESWSPYKRTGKSKLSDSLGTFPSMS
jgi:hypothetical protein